MVAGNGLQVPPLFAWWGHQHPSCGKSLEDFSQCFMGQSIAFRQIMGAERTLASVLCQVLGSDETVTCSPSQQHNESRWSGRLRPAQRRGRPAQADVQLGQKTPPQGTAAGLVSPAIGAVQLKCTRFVLSK